LRRASKPRSAPLPLLARLCWPAELTRADFALADFALTDFAFDLALAAMNVSEIW